MARASLPDTVTDRVIDVSHHNGAIDWPAVAAAGIAFVFVKATQGIGFVDPNFEDNQDAAADAGLMVAPYHFLDGGDPQRQAAHFLAVTGLAVGGVAMLDWESAATAAAAVAWGQAVAATTGRPPVAYYGFSKLAAPDPILAAWPLMLPAYPQGNRGGIYTGLVRQAPRLPPGRALSWNAEPRPYDFHQYTPAGRVGGIAGPVDRSVWVGTIDELQAWYAAPTMPVG